MSAAQVDEKRRKQIEDECTKEAWKAGATASATALGLAGATIGGANYFFHGFRTSLGVSGKAALIVSRLAACMLVTPQVHLSSARATSTAVQA